jgi:hypothetical protein
MTAGCMRVIDTRVANMTPLRREIGVAIIF